MASMQAASRERRMSRSMRIQAWSSRSQAVGWDQSRRTTTRVLGMVSGVRRGFRRVVKEGDGVERR
jgi:hypothetical protein